MAKNRPEGYEVAAAYVSLYADTEGLAEDIGVALDAAADEAADAGQRIGEELGDNTEQASQGKFKGLGQKIIGWGGLAAIGTAVGALFRSGLDNALTMADMERTMAVNLGVTPAIAKEYADVAGDLYAQGWGESLEEVGGNVQAMLSELGSISRDELESLAPQLMGIAEQTDTEIAMLANVTNKMLATGLVKSAQEAVDVIAMGYQTLGDVTGEDLLDTFNEYSTQLQKLGIDGQTAVGMWTQGIRAGAFNVDFLADALKELSIRAIDGSKTSEEAFKSIGLNAKVMQDKFAAGGSQAAEATQQVLDGLRGLGDTAEREAAAVGLFGTKAEDLGEALFAMDVNSATSALGEFTGTAQEMADASMSLEDMLGSLSRTLTLAVADAIRPVLPILRDGLSGLTGFLSFLRDNPVVTTILLGIGSAIAIAAAAQWAWNAASLANPTTWIIMAIVAAIGLLVAAIVFLVNNWENVTAVFANGLGQINAWWNDTVGAFTNGGAQIGDFFGGLFSGIGAWGAQTWANLSTGIANTVQTIVDMITWASNEVAQFVSFGTAQKIKAPKVPGSSKKVPGMATGGHVTQGGLSWVGEEGPELLYMSPGANIVPNDVSEQLAGGSGRGGDTFVFNNPVAEPSSLSVAKRRDEIAAALSL